MMVCLVETRTNDDWVNCSCAKLPNSWDWAVILAEGYSGGILVAWNELHAQVTSANLPWLNVGDFNSITSRIKHKGGTFSYYSRNAHYFLKFIEDNNLLDLHFSGPRFTWCNNQAGST